MKVAVIMNHAAGSAGVAHARDRAAAIRTAFTDAGVEVELHPGDGPRLADLARAAAASGVDAVVAAGGDGTVSAVASALAGGDVPLAVLPLGTLNHFAGDLGMPRELAAAARAIAAGTIDRVDVGEVNGRVFVNNSSIGLYPLVVRSRDAERRATGHGKWRAMAAASWRALRRFPLVSVHVRTPAGTVSARTPFVFVGNNAYRLGPRALGTRERLDAGRLCVYTMRCQSRLAMAWLVLRAIVQRVESIDALEVAEVDTADVVLWRRRIDVALDGEVVAMATPLRYRVRPRALAVIRPPAVATADAAQPVAAARPSPAGPPEAAA